MMRSDRITARCRALVTMGAATAALLVATLIPLAADASHGAGGLPAVVESERLVPGSDPNSSGSCVVGGEVGNPNPMTVTVRMAWRATDATGATLGVASARVPRLAAGERRSFRSSPFVSMGPAHTMLSCATLPRIERLDVVAEPSP